MKITKRFNFSASHRLFNNALTDIENREVFGNCNRSHGHNFVLDVMVEGRVDSKTGMVINFHELKNIVGDNVVSYLDHKDFEKDIPEFSNKVQTAENLAIIIWDILAGKLPAGIKLSGIRVAETNDNWVEYKG